MNKQEIKAVRDAANRAHAIAFNDALDAFTVARNEYKRICVEIGLVCDRAHAECNKAALELLGDKQ